MHLLSSNNIYSSYYLRLSPEHHTMTYKVFIKKDITKDMLSRFKLASCIFLHENCGSLCCVRCLVVFKSKDIFISILCLLKIFLSERTHFCILFSMFRLMTPYLYSYFKFKQYTMYVKIQMKMHS